MLCIATVSYLAFVKLHRVSFNWIRNITYLSFNFILWILVDLASRPQVSTGCRKRETKKNNFPNMCLGYLCILCIYFPSDTILYWIRAGARWIWRPIDS